MQKTLFPSFTSQPSQFAQRAFNPYQLIKAHIKQIGTFKESQNTRSPYIKWANKSARFFTQTLHSHHTWDILKSQKINHWPTRRAQEPTKHSQSQLKWKAYGEFQKIIIIMHNNPYFLWTPHISPSLFTIHSPTTCINLTHQFTMLAYFGTAN